MTDYEPLDDKKVSHKPKGLYVPNVVFGNPDLTYFDKFLFAVIDTLDGPRGCFASNEYLTKIMGVSIATMSAGIAKLIQQKYITQTNFDGRNRTLKINADFLKIHSKHSNFFEDRLTEKSKQKITRLRLQKEESFSKEKEIHSPSVESNKEVKRTRSSVPKNNTVDITPSKPPNTSCSTKQSFADSDESMSIVDAIFLDWNSRKLRKHNDCKTKVYRNSVVRIKRLLAGTMFNGSTPKEYLCYEGRKFKRAEFMEAFKRFERAATDPMYDPPEGTWKAKLRSFSLYDFLFHDKMNRSFFLEYLKNDATLLSEKFVKDEDPELTEAIMSEYKRQTRGDVSNKVPFIKAANKLNAFIAANESRIAAGMTPTNNMLAELLVSALTKGNGKTPAHYLHSDLMFKEILPEHFRREAVFKARNEEKPMKYKMATI